MISGDEGFQMRNGRVQSWNEPAVERAVPLLPRAGIDGPLVVGFDSLAERLLGGRVRGPTGGAPNWSEGAWPLDLQSKFSEALHAVRSRFEEKAWPPFLFLGSEVSGENPSDVARAVWEFRLAREAEMKTLYLGDPQAAREKMMEWLDVRCFGAGVAVGTGEHAAARFAECRAAGQPFWWRGCGTYNLHEGNMVRNRYFAGFLFWKSAADGCVVWTFQRPRGSVFNDFDGIDTNPESAKDACLTFPDRTRLENVPTPQWEGIREGVDDYAYAHTLHESLQTILRTDHPKKAKAQTIRDKFTELMINLPWATEQPFEGKITVPRLDQIRSQIADWIAELTP
jgi:hypothetical protein